MSGTVKPRKSSTGSVQKFRISSFGPTLAPPCGVKSIGAGGPTANAADRLLAEFGGPGAVVAEFAGRPRHLCRIQSATFELQKRAETEKAMATSIEYTDHTDEMTFIRAGGEEALAQTFNRYRDRLEQMVRFRLDQRLLGRVDPADVLQESYIEIARRFESYADNPTVSFYVWIRQITWQTLLTVHRRHLGQKRDAGQELFFDRRYAEQSSVNLAQFLAASLTSPSQAVIRDENLSILRHAIDAMDSVDQEILILRHFEQLSNAKVAEVLDLSPTAASNRYVRALRRLRKMLNVIPGG